MAVQRVHLLIVMDHFGNVLDNTQGRGQTCRTDLRSVIIHMIGQKFGELGSSAVRDPGTQSQTLALPPACTWHRELDLWGPAAESPGFVYIQSEGKGGSWPCMDETL